MNIEYRSANESDVPQLDYFLQQIVSVERPMDECLAPGHITYYNPVDFIKNDNATVVVAQCKDRLIACGAGSIVDCKDYYRYRQKVHLNMMYVDDGFRGQGVNGHIINKLLEWAKERGVKNASLTVYPDNPSAIKAYEKLGFETALIEMRLRDNSNSD